MINEIISMNGYGAFVWSAFGFTLVSFSVLYAIIKIHLVKEEKRFKYKFSSLNEEKKMHAKNQETFREILASINTSKI